MASTADETLDAAYGITVVVVVVVVAVVVVLPLERAFRAVVIATFAAATPMLKLSIAALRCRTVLADLSAAYFDLIALAMAVLNVATIAFRAFVAPRTLAARADFSSEFLFSLAALLSSFGLDAIVVDELELSESDTLSANATEAPLARTINAARANINCFFNF